MLGSSDDDGMSQEEMMELQREQEQERSEQELLNRLAGQADGMPAAPGYWETIGDPDVARDSDDALADFIATETSDKFALGQINYDDWQSMQWQIENEFFVMKNEFVDATTALDDLDMLSMGYGKRPELTNEKARRLRSAMQVKKIMASLSVDARGLRSGTEVHAVTRRETAEGEQEGEDDGGRLSRASSWLGR